MVVQLIVLSTPTRIEVELGCGWTVTKKNLIAVGGWAGGHVARWFVQKIMPLSGSYSSLELDCQMGPNVAKNNYHRWVYVGGFWTK